MMRVIVEFTPYEQEVRAFTNVRIEGKNEYVETIVLLKTEDGREMILQRMKNDIAILKRRYQVYSYLADYCKQLDDLSNTIVVVSRQSDDVAVSAPR